MKNLTRYKAPDLLCNRKSLLLLCFSLSVILGAIVRLPYFFTYDFALNDGALFAQMAEAIRSNGYVLPEVVEYNQTKIPFAYPPLAFYLVAFLADLFRLDLLEVVRYLPLVFNLLSISVFVLLAASLIKNKLILLYTSLFFPLIPRSYEWLIMGGGVTRSVGFFFALIAAYQANRALTKPDLKAFISCSVFLSMAALSHLEWGITGVVTVLLLVLSRQFNLGSFVLIVALGTSVLGVTSPWWVTVLSRHGLAPFLAASTTSEWDLSKLENVISGLKIFDDGLGLPLGILAVVGWLLSVARKDWFLPVWLVAIFLTTPRHGPTAGAMPLAILAAVGLVQFLIPSLVQVATLAKNKFDPIQVVKANNPSLSQVSPKYVALSCVALIVSLLLLTVNYVKHTPLAALTGNERNAMTWIKDNTPSESKFILLSQSVSWEDDRVAEWFPVLSHRRSLTTAQGLEWIPGNVFHSKVAEIKELKLTQALDINNLIKYVESHYNAFKYVAIFVPTPASNYGGFLESGQYRTIYNNDSALVLERLELKITSGYPLFLGHKVG